MTRQPIIFAIAVVAAIGFPACADNDADRSAGSDLTPAYDAAPGDAAGDSAGNAMANHADPFKPYTAVVSDEPPIKHDVVSGYFADDPSDREFESLRCVLPDVAGLGGDILFGGGPIVAGVDVWVFDDATCAPIHGATVILGDGAAYARTDENGHAALPTPPGAALVTAYRDGYRGWSYQADAASMVFRLPQEFLPDDYGISVTGHFLENGEPLALTNPSSVVDAFSQKAYAGFLLPAVSRAELLTADLAGLWSPLEFNLPWVYDFEGPFDLPIADNFFLPDMSLVFEFRNELQWGFMGGNDDLTVSLRPGAETRPLEGFVFSADLSRALDMETFLEIVEGMWGANPVGALFLSVLPKLFNDAVSVEYAGFDPEWAPDRPADLELAPITGEKGDVGVFATDFTDDTTILALMLADVPNRALIPIGVGAAAGTETALLPAMSFPDARHIALAMELPLPDDTDYPRTLRTAFRYASDPAAWPNGIALADADFGARFVDEKTSYDDGTGFIEWEIAGDDPSAFFVVVAPQGWPRSDGPFMAMLPGGARSLKLPVADLGYDPWWCDGVFIMAVDGPVDFRRGFDPTAFFAYDHQSISMWSNDGVENFFEVLMYYSVW